MAIVQGYNSANGQYNVVTVPVGSKFVIPSISNTTPTQVNFNTPKGQISFNFNTPSQVTGASASWLVMYNDPLGVVTTALSTQSSSLSFPYYTVGGTAFLVLFSQNGSFTPLISEPETVSSANSTITFTTFSSAIYSGLGISGYVYNAQGMPEKNAQVMLVNLFNSDGSLNLTSFNTMSNIWTTYTDSNGYYYFSNQNGYYPAIALLNFGEYMVNNSTPLYAGQICFINPNNTNTANLYDAPAGWSSIGGNLLGMPWWGTILLIGAIGALIYLMWKWFKGKK